MWRLLIRQPVGGIPEESSGGNPGEHYYYNQSVLALLTEYNYYTYSCNTLIFFPTTNSELKLKSFDVIKFFIKFAASVIFFHDFSSCVRLIRDFCYLVSELLGVIECPQGHDCTVYTVQYCIFCCAI